MRSKFSGNGREDNYSKRTAGEQRGNISRERVGSGYNLTGASGTRSDLYSEFIRLPEDAENPIAIQCIEEQHHNSRNIRKEKEREIDWDKSMLSFKLFCSSNFTIDCIKGAPVRIFEADHRKQYLPIRLPIFFKACGIIYSYDPIKICRHLFRAWVSFLKMNSPLSWLLWERIFNLKGGGGHFFYIFQKYKFISPKRLIMHCIFFLQSFNCSIVHVEKWR